MEQNLANQKTGFIYSPFFRPEATTEINILKNILFSRHCPFECIHLFISAQGCFFTICSALSSDNGAMNIIYWSLILFDNFLLTPGDGGGAGAPFLIQGRKKYLYKNNEALSTTSYTCTLFCGLFLSAVMRSVRLIRLCGDTFGYAALYIRCPGCLKHPCQRQWQNFRKIRRNKEHKFKQIFIRIKISFAGAVKVFIWPRSSDILYI